MRVIAPIILFVISLLVAMAVVTLIILYFVWLGKWPLNFTLESTDQNVPVVIYTNGYKAYDLTLQKGKKETVKIGNNIQNMTTRQPLQRNQMQNVTIHLLQNSPVQFISGNLPNNKTIGLYNDLSGFSQIKTDQSALDSGKWDQTGYYIITLPTGVKPF
jgi:hypothetical protein